LAAQGEAVREEERKRLAREIHDEWGQILTALRMDVSLLRLQFGVRDAALLEKVQGMNVLLDRAIQSARDIVSNLRPTALDMGIVSAVEWLCNEFTQHNGTVCVMRTSDERIDLDEAHAVVAFRIVQESLTNVARHSDASHVEITLMQAAGVLHMAVRDNGRGFDAAIIPNRKSFGLLGMRERAIALGGTVEIASTPQQGTVVSFSMPIQPDINEPSLNEPNGDIS
jgi:signal transduction histidine kinase